LVLWLFLMGLDNVSVRLEVSDEQESDDSHSDEMEGDDESATEE